jgi:hypothetical protein
MHDVTIEARLQEFVVRKAEFLSSPGCLPNFEELEADLGYDKEGLPEDRILSEWFDATVEEFSGSAQFLVHRHMTVPDFGAFVAGIEEGGDDLGDHWSTNPQTWSDHCEVLGCDIVLTGRVAAEQVDWFTTFQTRLVFPWEREIVFQGGVVLDVVRRMDDGSEWLADGIVAATEGTEAQVASRHEPRRL